MLDLYDEFGNYIGPEEASEVKIAVLANWQDEDGAVEEEREERLAQMLQEGREELVGEDPIVLYEDKKYYPEMSEVYPEAEAMIEDEDQMAITEPIVKPLSKNTHEMFERINPGLNYDFQFYRDLSRNPKNIRNVAFVGHLHAGKTGFCDILVEQCMDRKFHPRLTKRYTDARRDEQERLISVKASPLSFLLQSSSEKSFVFNMMDTPGHTAFFDEAAAGLRLSDGAVLVVDVVEGVMLGTEVLIDYLVHQQLPVSGCEFSVNFLGSSNRQQNRPSSVRDEDAAQ